MYPTATVFPLAVQTGAASVVLAPSRRRGRAGPQARSTSTRRYPLRANPRTAGTADLGPHQTSRRFMSHMVLTGHLVITQMGDDARSELIQTFTKVRT